MGLFRFQGFSCLYRVYKARGSSRFNRGRGLIQITGRTNYLKTSLALFQDDRLLKTPELLELLEQPEWAAESAAWFWWVKELNSLADQDRFTDITVASMAGSVAWPRAVGQGAGGAGVSSFTAFTAPLDVRYDAAASAALGADHWRVTRPFRFYVGSETSGEWVNVPAGYLTDGASVPQALWSLIPPWGAYGQAAVVHDILCEYLATTKDGVPHTISRARCDEILLEAMLALGVPAVKRCTIYRAVALYRRLSGVDAPTNTAQKRKLRRPGRSPDVFSKRKKEATDPVRQHQVGRSTRRPILQAKPRLPLRARSGRESSACLSIQ